MSRGSRKTGLKKTARGFAAPQGKPVHCPPASVNSHQGKHVFRSDPAYPFEILSSLFGEFVIQVDSRGAITSIWLSNEQINDRGNEFLGRTLRQLLGNSTYSHFSDVFSRVRRTHKSEESKYQIETATGGRWFSARVLSLAGGVAKRALSIDARDVTDQHAATEKLRESEALVAHGAQLGNFGCWELDLKSNTRRWSDETFRIFGLRPGEATPSRELWRRLIHPDDRERVIQATDRTIVERSALDEEFRLVRPDGETRMVHMRAIPFFDELKNAVRITGMMQDITEQKVSQAKIQQHETLLAQAEELAKIGSWTHDLQSDSVVWSDGAYRLFGLKPENGQPSAQDFRQMVHPDDREKLRAERAAAIAEHRPLDAEFRCILADGSMKFLHRRAMPFYNEKDEAVRFVGMTQDITEHQQEEDKLRRSEALLEEAEEVANLGSWEFNPKTRAAKISKHLLRMYGFSPGEEWDEKRYWNALDPVDHSWIREIYEQSISQSKPFAFSARYRMPDGTTKMHFMRGIPVPGADGTAERIYGIVQDVTEQRMQEANLHRLSQELIRTRDAERRETAIELHETAGQSLASLKMCLGRLRDGLREDDDRSLDLLEDAMNLAEDAVREVRVVSYLMHPAMLDEGGLNPAVHWLARGFSERSGIEVKVEIAEDFGRCSQDVETAVFRIVQESLTNVHRYSGSRTARIGIQREGEAIRAEVQDAGCGLPQPRKPCRSVVLAGVGIAGMRERVRQLNGEFTIESTPGRGTLVRAILPIAVEAACGATESLGKG